MTPPHRHDPEPPIDPRAIDPDVEAIDLPAHPRSEDLRTLALISVGGVIGALGRYGAGVAWPTARDAFPWTTLIINIVGSALLGALLAVMEKRAHWAGTRPLLGTGLIGGFTTFSTYAVDIERLSRTGHSGIAASY